MRSRVLLSLIMFTVVLGLMPSNISAYVDDGDGGGGIPTGIVGSDIRANTYLKAELIVVQANDADPNYDYYLVEFNMFDLMWQNDYFVDVLNTIIDIRAYTHIPSESNPVAIESYREPDPGWKLVPTGVKVSFYGLLMDVVVPGGKSGFSYVTNYNRVEFTADGNTGIVGWIFVMKAESGAMIGFRVPEGAGLEVTAYGSCIWYKSYVFAWKYIYGAYTPVVTVSVDDRIGT